jgi:hypothetical protein
MVDKNMTRRTYPARISDARRDWRELAISSAAARREKDSFRADFSVQIVFLAKRAG